FDLIVHIPGALIAGSSSQEAALFAGSKESLHDFIALRIRIAEIVALIDKHEVPITITHIFEQEVERTIVVALEIAHGKHARIELINFVRTLPHFNQRGRTDNHWACVLGPFKVFHNGRANIALTETNHVGNEYATKIANNLH